MFTKSTRLNAALSILFVTAMGACGGDIGAGCGCAMQPLPNNALPADQTVEGGGQIRVTQAGFQKLTALVPPLLNSQLEAGFCMPQGSAIGFDYCYQNDGSCAPGCQVDLDVKQTTLTVDSGREILNIKAEIAADVDVRIDPPIFGACTLKITAGDEPGERGLYFDLDIAFGIDAGTGELIVNLDNINDYDLSGLDFSGCSPIDWLGDILVTLIDSFLGEFIVDLLTPTINDLIQGFLPDPLGIEGLVDIGGLVGGVSPGTEASMEARMVPGGYVDLRGGGMSLGLITGLNADEDTATRSPDLDSEPHYCVPPIPAPNFAGPPHGLDATTRGTFTLLPAEEFLGLPVEPANDLVIGLSETTLDLGGHHAVTSGAMCLGVGTTLISQLNLGTFSLLVPSLGNLGEGTNPVLMVTRPQRALDFTIGDGTEESPALTIGINSFEVDIYVFVYERYTRAFSMRLDLAVGVNLTFEQLPGEPATVTPTLVGLEAENIEVAVLNNEFVAESQDQLEQVLPTIFDLAAGLLGDGLGGIEVPSFAGLTLNDLRVGKVVTSEDDFLAIYASLNSSNALRAFAETIPGMPEAVAALDDNRPVAQERAPVPATRLVSVDTPAPEVVRAALAKVDGGRLPSVTIEVPARDDAGRTLEHSWRLAGGLWRPYRTGDQLVISDRAFAWQAKYTIEVRSRVVGDYTTTSEISAIPVIIDSVPPQIAVDRVDTTNGLTVPATDLVSDPTALVHAWGRPADLEPWTDYAAGSTIDRATLDDLVVDGQVAVYVRDEAGNTARSLIAVGFHGQAGEGGCSCDAGAGAPSSGGIVLMLLTVGVFFRRRVVRLARCLPVRALMLWGGIVTVSSLVPACDCGGEPGVQYCEVSEDCTAGCPDDKIPFCLDGVCVCLDDIPYGRIGPYSDVAVAGQDVWVSAYGETHGDLMVAMVPNPGRIPDDAWEFVDGVPDGPVAIPQSDIRGGILEAGPDVGMYTSIATALDGTPIVTYFDAETGSLKMAAKFGGTWQIHTIDEGTGTIDGELGGEIAGYYTALTLRTDNGNPGVAYMAHVSAGAGVVTAEVRFAAAQTPTPSSAADWVYWTVDSIVLPPVDEANADPHPIPAGLGLFVDAARGPDQAPTVAYYDRVNGDLKVARFNVTAGTFDAPTVLAGGDGSDVGWYPSLAIDAQNAIHVSFLSSTRDDLLYATSAGGEVQLIDDGYRIVGTTEDGLPKPEFHFVGDDSNMILGPAGPVVVYQDATTHELLISVYNPGTGIWNRRAIAGDEAEFVGAYGFFASAAFDGQDVVISNWVIDQPHQDQWVEIHRETIQVQ